MWTMARIKAACPRIAACKVRIQQRSTVTGASISYYAKFSCALPKSTCVTEHSPGWCQVCVDAQTLQAYSLVCPGKVPREQVHLAHMLGALWLFGLLCADWHFFSPYLFTKIKCRRILFQRCVFEHTFRQKTSKNSPSSGLLILCAPLIHFHLSLRDHDREGNVKFKILYVKICSK